MLSVGFLEKEKKKKGIIGKKRKRDVVRKERRKNVMDVLPKSEPKRPKKKQKIDHLVSNMMNPQLDPRRKSTEVIPLENLFQMLQSKLFHEIRRGLYSLQGEHLSKSYLTNKKYPIGQTVYSLRASQDEQISTLSSTLIREWSRRNIFHPAKLIQKKVEKLNISESDIKKLFDTTGTSVRDFVIISISKALILQSSEDQTLENHPPKEIVKLSEEIEQELQRTAKGGLYKRKFMQMNTHLKDLENSAFRRRILNGQIGPKKLVNMSPSEMASKTKIRERERLKKEKNHLKMAYQKDKIKDGMYRCRKCGSKKTTVYEMQTRCADEPMTQFVTCVRCGKRWRR